MAWCPGSLATIRRWAFNNRGRGLPPRRRWARHRWRAFLRRGVVLQRGSHGVDWRIPPDGLQRRKQMADSLGRRLFAEPRMNNSVDDDRTVRGPSINRRWIRSARARPAARPSECKSRVYIGTRCSRVRQPTTALSSSSVLSTAAQRTASPSLYRGRSRAINAWFSPSILGPERQKLPAAARYTPSGARSLLIRSSWRRSIDFGETSSKPTAITALSGPRELVHLRPADCRAPRHKQSRR